MYKMMKTVKNKSYILFAFLYLLPRAFLFAAPGDDTSGGSVGLQNPIQATSITALLASILDFIVRLGLPVIVVAIIYSGFMFVVARGKPAELEVAKKNLVYVMIGAAIILGAKVLSVVITGTVDGIRAGL